MSSEERELIDKALRQSLNDQPESDSECSEPAEFDDIEPMHTLHPTEAEFQEPIRYIESLYKDGFHKYGCVKIVPPASFKPPMGLKNRDSTKVPYRTQNLHSLRKNKVSV